MQNHSDTIVSNDTLIAADSFFKTWLSGGVVGSKTIPQNYFQQGRGEALSVISGCRILEIGLSLYSKTATAETSKNVDASEARGREHLYIYKEGENCDVSESLGSVMTAVS